MRTTPRRSPFTSFLALICLACLTLTAVAQADPIPKLQNPIDVQYLKKNLKRSQPRLVLNRDLEKQLRLRLKTDPVVQNHYSANQRDAEASRKEPLLDRKQTGRRPPSVCRERPRRENK